MIDGDGPRAPALARDAIKRLTHHLSRHILLSFMVRANSSRNLGRPIRR